MPEYCRNWKGDERCGEPAEFVVWGKLFPPDALGPRCYDCAADQVGHHGLAPGNPQGYAVYHLPKSSPAQHIAELGEAEIEKFWEQAGRRSSGRLLTSFESGYLAGLERLLQAALPTEQPEEEK